MGKFNAGFQASSGGGGTGNLSGTLTPGTLPIATAPHTLGDSLITFAGSTYTIADFLALVKAVTGSDVVFTVHNTDAAAGSDAFVRVLANAAGSKAKIQFAAGGTSSYLFHDEATSRTYLAPASAGPALDGLSISSGDIRAHIQLVIGASTRLTPVALAVAAGVVDTDAAASDLFNVALSANATLADPSNPQIGRRLLYRIRNAGAFTLAYGPAFRFVSAVAPVVSVGAGVTTVLGFLWNETDSVWDAVGPALGPFG